MRETALSSAKTFGLRVQPMVHVDDMPASISLYEALGGRLVYGSRDGDWALIDFEGSTLSLLAHPPGDGQLQTVELQFICGTDLHAVEAHLKSMNPALIDRGVADEMFGRMLKVRTADGLLIKILQLERDIIE
jgi:catechol 2,3-dioxygenase-like lactoylglutathione lyase family enzyme